MGGRAEKGNWEGVEFGRGKGWGRKRKGKREEGENACVNLLSQKGRGSSELGLDKTIGR